jgi:hypothetical protein
MRISAQRGEGADMAPSERGVDSNPPHMPSDVTGKVGFFDRFATRASHFASRAWFFAGCVLVVALWAPTYLLVDTWQLIVKSPHLHDEAAELRKAVGLEDRERS